jgi:hypothetical protein
VISDDLRKFVVQRLETEFAADTLKIAYPNVRYNQNESVPFVSWEISYGETLEMGISRWEEIGGVIDFYIHTLLETGTQINNNYCERIRGLFNRVNITTPSDLHFGMVSMPRPVRYDRFFVQRLTVSVLGYQTAVKQRVN